MATRITFNITTRDGRLTFATLAHAGMVRRGFTDMESYAADFVRRHEAVGSKVVRRAVAIELLSISALADCVGR